MESINWEDVYVQLYAYTDHLLKAYSWFRGAKTDSYLKGKQVHDYIADAIEKYLKSPEKFDASYGRSLVNYLKKHIIRSLISNDAKSPENITSSGILSYVNSINEEDDPFINVDALLPIMVANFDREIDCKKILSYIHSEIQDDKIVLLIFEEICFNGSKRREVIHEHNLIEPDFDNGMKRLKTVLNNTAKKFELTKAL